MADQFTGISGGGRELVINGRTIEIPQRSFARPEPVAIPTDDDDWVLPDVPEQYWLWDTQSREWIPEPSGLEAVGIKPPFSFMTIFILKAMRRANLRSKDGFWTPLAPDRTRLLEELGCLSAHMVLANLRSRRAPSDVVEGHVSLCSYALALEYETDGSSAASSRNERAVRLQHLIRNRDDVYRKHKTNQDPVKSALARKVGENLLPALATVPPAAYLTVFAHAETVAVSTAVGHVPLGFWSPPGAAAAPGMPSTPAPPSRSLHDAGPSTAPRTESLSGSSPILPAPTAPTAPTALAGRPVAGAQPEPATAETAAKWARWFEENFPEATPDVRQRGFEASLAASQRGSSPADAAAAGSDVVRHARTTSSSKWSFQQPKWHVALLSLVTLGAYYIYWAFRNWRQLRREFGYGYQPWLWTCALVGAVFIANTISSKKAAPAILAFFVFRLMYGQFKNITHVAHRHQTESAGSPVGWALLFTLPVIVDAVPGIPDYEVVFIALAANIGSVATMVGIQGKLNRIWASVEPGLPIRKGFSGKEIAVLVGFPILWVALLVILVIAANSGGSTPSG